MNKLDTLVNQKIFNGKEPRAFSVNDKDSEFLIKEMTSQGYVITPSNQQGYFFCTVEKGDVEVCSDSRANLKPRTLKEAICVACLKHYTNSDQEWATLAEALDLDIKELERKARNQ